MKGQDLCWSRGNLGDFLLSGSIENRLHQGSGKRLLWLVESAQNCAAVIPCFNEAGTISGIVQGALRHAQRIWVVDDASSDATAQEAERAGATVIRHAVNLGKGAALRAGLGAAGAAGFGYAVTLDGDGQHDPREILILLEAAHRGADLVIGDRMGAPETMTQGRRFVNRWMSARLEKLTGVRCPDSQCGFRVVRLEAWAGLNFRQNRFEVESEMFTSFARAGLKIVFVPVKSLPAKRPSRIRPVIDSMRWFRWWFTTK
jgi:glycosyltransferase involved in cell wall biosynthesis